MKTDREKVLDKIINERIAEEKLDKEIEKNRKQTMKEWSCKKCGKIDLNKYHGFLPNYYAREIGHCNCDK